MVPHIFLLEEDQGTYEGLYKLVFQLSCSNSYWYTCCYSWPLFNDEKFHCLVLYCAIMFTASYTTRTYTLTHLDIPKIVYKKQRPRKFTFWNFNDSNVMQQQFEIIFCLCFIRINMVYTSFPACFNEEKKKLMEV